MLFPEFETTVQSILNEKDKYSHEIFDLWKKVKSLENELEPYKNRSVADVMKQELGILPIDFTNVHNGAPMDFLNIEDKIKRQQYVAQLAQIYELEVFPVMIHYFINLQGNYSFRTATTDLEIFAGRMTVNGISLIRNKVKEGHDEFMEGRTGKDDDEEENHSSPDDEIIISEVMQAPK